MPLRRLLIVVPCLNEAESLPGLLDQLQEAQTQLRGVADVDVLVVDDGSVDNTAEIARARGVRVARLSHNLGIGGAVQTGLRLAARDGYDGAIQIDGDGQHPPSQIGKLLETFASSPPPDLVIGSRFIDRQGFQSTRLRRVGITWLSFVLRVAVGLKVADPVSGFRLFGVRALHVFERAYPYDYPEPESLAVAQLAKLKVAEVPVVMKPRQGGSSSIMGLRTVYYMVKVTLAVLLTVGRSVQLSKGFR